MSERLLAELGKAMLLAALLVLVKELQRGGD